MTNSIINLPPSSLSPASIDRYLLDGMSFDLAPTLNSLEGLLFFEQQVEIAAEDWQDAKTRFAYHIYMICEHKLYLHHRNGIGPTYPTQQEYLRYLDQKVGRAVSTMKRDYSALRTARFIGIDTPQKLSDTGIEVIVDVWDGFKTDSKTGEPKGLKSGRLPANTSAADYFRQCVQKLSRTKTAPELNLRKGDYGREKERLLSPGKPAIKFERYDDGSRKWIFEQYDESGMLTFYSGYITIEANETGFGIFFAVDEAGHLPDEIMDLVVKELRLI